MNSDFFKMPERIFGISSSLIRLFLLPVGVIIIFFMSLGGVIIPRVDSIKSLQNSVTKIRSEIKTVDSKRAYLASVDQDELIKNENYLSSAVLQEKNSYLLVGIVRNISDKFGFRIKSFLVTPVKIKEGTESLKILDKDVATKLPIDLVLEGPTDKIIDLLTSIESSLPIMFIENVDIVNKQSNSEIKFTISSYYIPDNPNLVSGNLTLNDLIPSKEESSLLSVINQFTKDESLLKSTDEGAQSKVYIEYQRDEPFTSN